jgi:hypothetical protein
VLSAWSRGMIPPSGGGGLGFDSPSGPTLAFFATGADARQARDAHVPLVKFWEQTA